MSDAEIEKILFKMADNLFERNFTVTRVVRPYIMDKVVDGKEYQLIRRERLIKWLEKYKIIEDYGVKLNKVFFPFIDDLIDVKNIQKILSEWGIKEDIPYSTKHLNYEMLEGPAIRTFNKIIKYLDDNNIMDVSNKLKFILSDYFI